LSFKLMPKCEKERREQKPKRPKKIKGRVSTWRNNVLKELIIKDNVQDIFNKFVVREWHARHLRNTFEKLSKDRDALELLRDNNKYTLLMSLARGDYDEAILKTYRERDK